MINLQEGWTPLMIAAFNGYVDVMEILIKARVDINQKTKVHVV